MTEENKFIKVDSIPLYNDGIGIVSLYDASHANEAEEQRIWTVTTIASLAYGNEEAKNPKALYERMKSIKHESLWEFIRHGLEEHSTIPSSMRRFMGTNIAFPLSDFTKSHKANIACFRIKVPIFVARQFMRHRSFSYLEVSRRYTKGVKIPFEFWFPLNFEGITLAKNDWGSYKPKKDNQESFYLEEYYNLISAGYETQVASRFLPQTTYTEFYVMGEVEGLRNFLNLRLDSHAQAEIREVAEAMLVLLVQHQPELANKVII